MNPLFRVYFTNEKKTYNDISLSNISFILGRDWECEPHVIQRKSQMTDGEDTPIYEGDIVFGFEREFEVKYGKLERNVLDYDERNSSFVDIEGFYFEDRENGMRLFPLIENVYGEHDLDQLIVIGSINSLK